MLSKLILTLTLATTLSQSFGKAGDYDVLIFARFWMGEPASEIPCSSVPAGNLTLHGIWPQYDTPRGSHGWPQFCNTSSMVASVDKEVSDYFADMWAQVAPAYPAGTSKKFNGLAEHEWSKHGTCWSASTDNIAAGDVATAITLKKAFFQASIDLNNKFPTPDVLRKAWRAGSTVATTDIQSAFGGANMVALQCDGGNSGNGQLSMVSLCFTKDLKQTVCPESMLSEPYTNNCALSKIAEISVAYNCSS